MVTYSGLGSGLAHIGPAQVAIWALYIWYAGAPADLQAMHKRETCSLATEGHLRPVRLLSARFGKSGASATVGRSLSPRSTKGETAASSPLYGSFSAYLGLWLRPQRVN